MFFGIPYNIFWTIVTIVVSVLFIILIVVLTSIAYELRERNRLLAVQIDLLNSIVSRMFELTHFLRYSLQKRQTQSEMEANK